jgi:hypothetical protein
MSVTNGVAPASPVVLPPLYKGLQPVTPEQHGKLRLREAGYGFAAEATAIPLAAEEFGAASRSLPVVFAAQAPNMPVAVTSLAATGNRFVGADGAWRAGAYIPAYLRRYPFFLVRMAPGSEELVLCIDPSAPHLSETEGEPLFTADGKATPVVERALNFARAVEDAARRTEIMVQGLNELGLLKPAVVQFERAGAPFRIDGFHAIDRPTLMALPPEKLAELRDKGWLEAMVAQLLSLQGLGELSPQQA